MSRAPRRPGPERWAVWLLRLAWLGLPAATVGVFGDAVDGVSTGIEVVAVVGLYAGWAIGLLATLLPSSVSLTVVRVGGPAALAVTAWAVAAGRAVGVSDGAALTWVAVVVALSLAGMTADAFVDGSSYGNERRFALRTPIAVLLGPAEVAWLAVVVGVVGGPLLLAARQWVAGGLALVGGAAATWVGVRALHQLSRRWVVFVPAGVVLHDPLTLADSVLCRRQSITALDAAVVGATDAELVDVSGGAPGLVLELRLRDPVTVGRRGRRGEGPREVSASRIRFTPIRAGAVLAETRRRRVPTG